MSQQLRQYLETIGLKKTATEAQAWAFLTGLEGEQADQARAILDQEPEEAAVVTPLRGYLQRLGLSPQASEEQADAYLATLEGDNLAIAQAIQQRELTDTSAEEGVRIQGALTLATKFHLPAGWAAQAIADGLSGQQQSDAIQDWLHEQSPPIRLAVGDDLNRATLTDSMSDAICLRAAPDRKLRDERGQVRAPSPRAAQFAGRPLLKLMEMFLAATGQATGFMSAADIRRLAWDRTGFNRQPLGLHTTSDFTSVLANAANKSLLREYAEAQPQWPKFCRRATATDFKEIKRVALGEAPNLTAVAEGGEYGLCTVADREEAYRLIKYGKAFDITWEAIAVNDDLSAFNSLPQKFMRSARRLEDSLPITLLVTNANMGDAHPLFDATYHKNVAEGSDIDPPSVATLNAMRLAMRKQTGQTADAILNIELAVILVSAAREAYAERLLLSESDPSQSNPNVSNPWKGKFALAVSPLLDAANAAAPYYGFGDPVTYEGIELCFLQGLETPTLQQVDSMNPDKRSFAIRHVVAAKAVDWRSMYYNAGT